MAAFVPLASTFMPIQLGTVPATIYQAPTQPTSLVISYFRVRFANTSNGTQAVTVYAVVAGGTATAANCCANGESIAANTHLDLDLPVLAAGGFYQANAGAANVITASQLGGAQVS